MENLLSRVVHAVFQECCQFQENTGRLSSNSSVRRTWVLCCVALSLGQWFPAFWRTVVPLPLNRRKSLTP